jgi:hypothetical protein
LRAYCRGRRWTRTTGPSPVRRVRTVAERRLLSPGVASACGNRGWTWPGIAWRLRSLALGLALSGSPVELTAAVEQHAGQLARTYAFRGAGAVHLASALAIGDPDLILAAWDRRLHAGAQAAGLNTAPAQLDTQIPRVPTEEADAPTAQEPPIDDHDDK